MASIGGERASALVDLEKCSASQLDALRARVASARRADSPLAEGESDAGCELDALRVEVARSPSVLVWLCEQQGAGIGGVLTLEGWYDAFSARLLTAQPDALLLAGRGAESAQLVGRLRASPERIALVATEHEALAFIAAVLQQQAPEQLARAFFVSSAQGWELLCTSALPLVLIASCAMPFDVQAAISAGHHVVTLCDRAFAHSAATSLRLGQATLPELAEALSLSGVSIAERERLARLGQRSLWALLCALDADPEARLPRWVQAPSDAALAFVLAGHHDERFEADGPIVAQLAGVDVGALRAQREALSSGETPLLRARGEVWHTLSRRDAFCWLAGRIASGWLDKLGRAWEAAVASRLAPEHLLLAGRPPLLPENTCSVWLMEGLSEALCLLVAHEGEERASCQRFVDACVSSLCAQLVSVRHWATMLCVLPLLAEAAPETVLQAIEEASDGPSPLLAGLLAPDASVLARTAPRSLFSAIEIAARMPAHSRRVVRLLGRLAHIERTLTKRASGGALSSLVRLLRVEDGALAESWAERCQMLDELRQREPDVGWVLMLALVPASPRLLTRAACPRHRMLSEDTTGDEALIDRAREQLLARLLHDGHASPHRFASLVALIETLPQAGCDLLVRELLSLDPASLRDGERESLRASLRSLIAHLRSGSDDDWLLAESRCMELRRVYDHLEPQDLVDRHGWLFDHRPLLLEGQKAAPHEHAALTAKAQRGAVEAIWQAAGLDGVVRLAERAPAPWLVGQALALSLCAADVEPHLLALGQLGLAECEQRLMHGFWAGRRKTGGRAWAEQLLARPGWQRWPARSKRDFFLVMPFAPETWRALSACGEHVARAYWQAIDPSEREDVSPDIRMRVAREMASVGELSGAFAWLLTAPTEVDDDLFEALAFELLDKLARRDAVVSERVMAEQRVEAVFAALADKRVAEPEHFARLEWHFLDRIAPAVRPRALSLGLAHDAARFVEVLSLAYSDSATTEPDDQRRALLLLASWSHLPGAGEDGLIDVEPMRRWVRQARSLACAAGLLDEADEHLGRQLLLSPQARDGLLLHEAVRELVESLGSEAMLTSFAQSLQGDAARVLASTGVDPRKPRRFVAYCRRAVEVFSPRWPRIASSLRSVANAIEQRLYAQAPFARP